MSIACLWVNLVPAFESPDESAHFDYVFALASNGGLLRAADGPVGTDPRVATAIRDSDLLRISHHNDQRVAATYGSNLYREAIRIENEVYRDYSPRTSGAVRPELASVYPFVPYALYALVALPFRGDVLSALYACRFASVAFTAIGILGWSGILRRIGIGKVHAIALVTIVAFFPLTSFVGSYVQPDTVAFAIVSLLLLVALRIRDGHANLAHGFTFALLLSMLYGTKLQFAAVVGIATILPVARAYGSGRSTRKCAALVGGGLVAGLGTIAFASRWVMSGSRSANYFEGPHSLTSALRPHFSTDLFAFLLVGSRTAIIDLFGGGDASRSFWGVFGWLDTPIRIVDFRRSQAFASAETLATEFAGTTFVIALAIGLQRLIRIATRRSSKTAFRLATNDPAINSYVAFALLLVCLYVSSGDVFGAQGRDWFALETVAFASASWYAMRAFPRRLRRLGSAIVLASLVVYASIGSASALTTIEDRFYGPAIPNHELQR